MTVDESIVGFKGRHVTIQYLPNKHHHQWGPKVWVGADSSNGYTFKFDFYRGSRFEPPGPNGLAYEVVMKIMRGLLDKSYHCHLDNFYTSPKLCKDLFTRKTNTTGTCRANRAQLLFKQTRLNKGDLVYMRHRSLLAVKWRDKKDVIVLSTVARARNRRVQRARRRDREVELPESVALYNK